MQLLWDITNFISLTCVHKSVFAIVYTKHGSLQMLVNVLLKRVPVAPFTNMV